MEASSQSRIDETMSAADTGSAPPRAMRAAIQTTYGSPDVLELKTVDRPIPGEKQVLIRIHATSVTATEAMFRQGKPYITRLFTGLRRPKMPTLGEELAGEIVEVGSEVTRFTPGDHVFGTAGPSFGAAAEYLCVDEDEVLLSKPSALSYEESAASVDGFLTALPFLRDKGEIRAGMHVLVNGASGSVGSSAVQIAKYFGAEVTAVCSGANAEFVSSIGADHVIDYTREEFSARRSEYDLIFDAVGKIGFWKSRRALRPKGVFLEAGMNGAVLFSVIVTALFGRRKARIAATGLRPAPEKLKDLSLLQELLAKGTIVPTIDRTYPLEQIADAHRYVDTGRKRGNVAVSVGFRE